ncbi:MAG TPA: dicarboxylate/amino acid:cation symporter [Devosia sp.]|nr:dicarboxylate/amino acid:cation symporter [Devosia sp.]
MAIALALVLGVIAGAALHHWSDTQFARTASLSLPVMADVFLRLIKMIIAPLVLATLMTGIAQMEDIASLGRIGARALCWFLAASVVSLMLGMLCVSILQPGNGAHLILPAAAPVGGTDNTLSSFLDHIVPSSVVQAMATNEILQIVVFSTLAGVAMTAAGPAARPLIAPLDALSTIMLKMTAYIMWVAPLAVFAAVAVAVGKEGAGILWLYGRFVIGFYATLLLFWALLLTVGLCFAGRRVLLLPRVLRNPLLLAFSTASSEAALAPTLAALDEFGVPSRISGFVLPLGYSFNLDGSMMYCTFAAMFIAQACDIELAPSQIIGMLATFLVTSKGIAGVPRASLVVLAATMPKFGIPEAGVLLILGVDHFLDMGRTATNVVGNAVAATVIAHRERHHLKPCSILSPHPLFTDRS